MSILNINVSFKNNIEKCYYGGLFGFKEAFPDEPIGWKYYSTGTEIIIEVEIDKNMKTSDVISQLKEKGIVIEPISYPQRYLNFVEIPAKITFENIKTLGFLRITVVK